MSRHRGRSRCGLAGWSVVALSGLVLVTFPWWPLAGQPVEVTTPQPSVATQPQELETASGQTQPDSTEPSETMAVDSSDTPVSNDAVESDSSGVSTPSEPAQQTATASPSRVQTEAPSARPMVKMSEPTHISIAEIGYEADVSQMTTDNGVVDPPTKELTYRVTDRGSQPGEDANNTVYMACHSATRSFAPCNTVYKEAAVGQTISLTTEAGQLTYRIESIETLSKDGEFENSEKVRSKVPGRLVLVTCLQRGIGRSSAENFVVFAQLIEK